MGLLVWLMMATASEPLSTAWIRYGVAFLPASISPLSSAATIRSVPPAMGTTTRLIPSRTKKFLRCATVSGSDDRPVAPAAFCPYRNVINSSLRAAPGRPAQRSAATVSYTHLRAHETRHDLVCRLLLEKK